MTGMGRGDPEHLLDTGSYRHSAKGFIHGTGGLTYLAHKLFSLHALAHFYTDSAGEAMALGSNNVLPTTFINKTRVYVLYPTLWIAQGFRWDGQAKYPKLLVKEMTQDTLYVSLKPHLDHNQ